MNDLKKVKPGQRIRAADINSITERLGLLEISADPISTQFKTPLAGANSGLLVPAENIDLVTLAPLSVVVIKGQSHNVSTADQERGVVLKVGVPGPSDALDSIAICVEQILPGEVKPVCVHGVAWALADGSSGVFASLLSGTAWFTLGTGGPAQVLAGSGTNKVLVRFPTGSGGGGQGGVLEAHVHDDIGIWGIH